MKKKRIFAAIIFCVSLLSVVFFGAMCSSGTGDSKEGDSLGIPAKDGKGGAVTRSAPGTGQGGAPKRKGSPAADFTLKDTKGDSFTLSMARGKVVIMNFWATWCPPCRMEIPELIKLYNRLKNEEIELIGISLDQTENQAVKGAEKFKIPYRIFHDTGKRVATRYGIRSIPSLFIIDREGNLRHTHKGFDPRTFPGVEREILSLLAEKAGGSQT